MAEACGCGDCGAHEGQIHEYGCDMERCPFCGGQLITCDCCYYHVLGIRVDYSHPTCGLPLETFENGLTGAQRIEWIRILEEKGRIPYISYPIVCARCGALWPDLFMVPNEEWDRYIQMNQRRSVLCRDCYETIKSLIDTKGGTNER